MLVSSGVDPTPAWLAEAGFDAYLVKPVLPSTLLDTLATLGGRLDQGVEIDPAARSTPRRWRPAGGCWWWRTTRSTSWSPRAC